MPDFLSNIFHSSSQELPNFGVPRSPLPITFYETNAKINPTNFFLEKEFLNQNNIKLVEFRVLPFPIEFVPGSETSLEMLHNIFRCTNSLIFRTDLIKILITFR